MTLSGFCEMMGKRGIADNLSQFGHAVGEFEATANDDFFHWIYPPVRLISLPAELRNWTIG